MQYTSSDGISRIESCDGTNWVIWAGSIVSGIPAPQFTSAGGITLLGGLLDVDLTSGIGDGDCLAFSSSSGDWAASNSCGGGGGGLWTAGTGDDIYYDATTPQVGIGKTDPGVALDVVGDIHFTGQIMDVSDIRMKYDIAPLDSPLKKLTTLNGLSFKMKGDEKEVTEYGVSAQDVEKVFPELVHHLDDEGTLGVSYQGLIAPMIEAIKEQQAQIEALRLEIETLKAEQNNKPGEL